MREGRKSLFLLNNELGSFQTVVPESIPKIILSSTIQMKQSLKATKKESVWWMIVKLFVFLAVLAFVVMKMYEVNWSQMDAFHLEHPWALILAVFLVIPNQWFEYLKWERIARTFIEDKRQIRKAFWGGIASGFLSPNGWGNFIGRMVFFQKRDRLFIVVATGLANISQLLPTLIFGCIALVLTRGLDAETVGFSLVLAFIVLLGYAFWEQLIPSRKSRNVVLRKLQYVKLRLKAFKWPLFLYSLLRFHVFSLQYVLLFVSFGYTDLELLFINVWMIYLFTSFVPSLWSGKVVIRETAAIMVFAASNVLVPDIVLISLLIWIINLVLPATISSFAWIPFKKS